VKQKVEAVPTVFVVDDDVSIRESLETLIRSAGLGVRCFASAEEFLAYPDVLSPCCVIVDFSLPYLDGLDLQQLIADRTEMPVIFVTGHRNIPLTVRAMKAGAVEFLTKPFRTQSILAAVAEALGRSRRASTRNVEIGTIMNRFDSLSGREREVLALVM